MARKKTATVDGYRVIPPAKVKPDDDVIRWSAVIAGPDGREVSPDVYALAYYGGYVGVEVAWSSAPEEYAPGLATGPDVVMSPAQARALSKALLVAADAAEGKATA